MVGLPPHHVPWYDTWTAWRWIGLRATGFPVELLQGITFPACAAAAERLAKAEAGNEGEIDEAEIAAARSDYEQQFEAAYNQQAEALNELTCDPRFQQAVLWQNYEAYRNGVCKLPETRFQGAPKKRRQREQLVAKYLQRYTVKNDTIGFFGPMAWARWSDSEDPVVRLEPQSELVEARDVFLEGWGVVALAKTLLRLDGIRTWLPPQLLPFHWLDEDSRLNRLTGPALVVDDDQLAVLEAADGSRSAHQLCRELAEDPECVYQEPAEVMAQLEHFQREGCLGWDFHLPAGPYALQALRSQVESIGDNDLRRAALAPIEEVEAARQRVVQAAGDVNELEAALGSLNATFHGLTGAAATRHAGQDYAARTLAYEDCRRAGTFEFGPEVRRAIAEPMSLILHSVRWLSAQVATALRQMALPLYRDLTHTHGPEVPVQQFWPLLSRHLIGDNRNAFTEEALDEFQRRWQEVLEVEPGRPGEDLVEEVRRSVDELRPRVEATFPMTEPGWSLARYTSPDVLLAAEGPDALRAGDFFAVLGEMHVAHNSLSVWATSVLHPDLDALREALEAEIQETRFHLQDSNADAVITRFGSLHIPSRDLIVAARDRRSVMPPEQRVEPDDLIVVDILDSGADDQTSGLRLRSQSDERVDFDIAEAVAKVLTHSIVSRCRLLGDADYWPRVRLDRLVVNRRRWSFDGAEMDFVQAATPAARFAGARAWWLGRQLPERVFLRVDTELKPIYVDFSCPVFIELLARAVRAALAADPHPRVRLAEMLPDLHQTWLPDADGQRYTCELRIVITDRRGYPDRDAPDGTTPDGATSDESD